MQKYFLERQAHSILTINALVWIIFQMLSPQKAPISWNMGLGDWDNELEDSELGDACKWRAKSVGFPLGHF